MCGIVGYLGKRRALPLIISGLEKLEYRGYDSVGIAVFDSQTSQLLVRKSTQRIQEFKKEFAEKIKQAKGKVGLGHTRWATHGGVSRKNAHPQADCKKSIFVVHNGIIENFQVLKSFLLKKGHIFNSETDTEVVPHLIEEFCQRGLAYPEAVRQALRSLQGSFALVIFNKQLPELLIGARFASPLVLGVGEKELIFASDVQPLAPFTSQLVYLNDGEMAVLTPQGYKVSKFSNGERLQKKISQLNWKVGRSAKAGFAHYMLKEIKQEPEALQNALRGRIVLSRGEVKQAGLEEFKNRLKKVDKVVLAACGTAAYAGLVGEYFIGESAGLEAKLELASELRYKKPHYNSKTLLIAISQSGETADTLQAMKLAKAEQALVMGIVNVPGSSIARQVDFGIYTYAGPERAVASTKAFISQLGALYLTGIFLGRQRTLSLAKAKAYLRELKALPKKLTEVFGEETKIVRLVKKYARYRNFLYLGRKYSFPVALEGALKLKEVSYIHAEAYPAGEMKHGPIALIEPSFPSVVVAPQDSVYEKAFSNLQEIKARQGKIISLTTQGNSELAKLSDEVIYLPQTLEPFQPLLYTIPLHLIAYYLAKELKRDIDRPRNLAKSVTVE